MLLPQAVAILKSTLGGHSSSGAGRFAERSSSHAFGVTLLEGALPPALGHVSHCAEQSIMIYNTIQLFMNYSEGVKPKGKNLSALEAES